MKFQEIRNATAIITYANTKFLLDPFLAPRGSYPPVPSPYNNTPNPMVDLPLPIEEIIKVEATIVTHMHHFDHFDEFAARNLLILYSHSLLFCCVKLWSYPDICLTFHISVEDFYPGIYLSTSAGPRAKKVFLSSPAPFQAFS